MTDERRAPDRRPDDDAPTAMPLDPQLLALARDAIDVEPEAIPREMMWARLQHRRQQDRGPRWADAASSPAADRPAPLQVANDDMRDDMRDDIAPLVSSRRSSWMLRAVGIAALLLGGVGVGRYLLPTTGPSRYEQALLASVQRADSIAELGLGPEALAALPPSTDPARVAMDEHLARTVSLLTTVRDEDPELGPGADISGWARDLLGTTRLLIDEPQLRDERTRRLLQDLELVLAQIVQVRGSAPETKRAPSETMRETNLLPRMRAAVTASRFGDETTLGGGL